MTQNDFNLADQSGASYRSDNNSALQALASLSSGTSAPSTTYAYMLWADTTNNVLKQRNAGNSAWTIIATLDDDRVLSKTSDFTVALADYGKTFLVDTTSGVVTATLPAVSTAADGFFCRFIKINSGSNAIILDGSGSETINGSTTLSETRQWAALNIITSGAAWYTMNVFIPAAFIDSGHLSSAAITGLTEDASPASGDFLMTYDVSATALKKIQVSNLTGTTKTYTHVYQNSGPTGVPTATPTKFQFDTEVLDTGSEYDNSSTFKYVASSAKKVCVIAGYTADALAGDMYIYIKKNGTTVRQMRNYGGGTVTSGITLSHIIDLAQNDYIEVYGEHYGGSNKNFYGATMCVFTI